MTNGDHHRDGRSDLARGYALASRATSIGIQMVIPPAAGWWADSRFKTEPWFLVSGTVLGFVILIVSVMRLANESKKSKG